MCHSTLFNELTRKLMAFRCCSTLLYKDKASFYLFSFSSLLLYLICNFCFTIFNWLLLQYIISLVIFLCFRLKNDEIHVIKASQFNIFYRLQSHQHKLSDCILDSRHWTEMTVVHYHVRTF